MGRFTLSRRHRFVLKTRKSKSVDIPANYKQDDDECLDRYRERALRRWKSFTPGCTSVLISSRNPFEEFHRLFPSLPQEEFPLNVYTCALSKDILLQGKMFVSQNWICFYSNIFGYETKVKIEMDRIVAISREKTAFVVPNAISVQTPSKRFFFCSFLSRETVFRLISRTWKAAIKSQDCMDRSTMDETSLIKTDCNDNESTVSVLDFTGEDLPHAVCSDIDEVKTSSPLPNHENFNLFPSAVKVNTLHKRNGYHRVSITTKPETKMTRWNTIADLREIKPNKRKKKQLQFQEEGYEIFKEKPHNEYGQPRCLSSVFRWLQASKHTCTYKIKDVYKRLITVSALFYIILLTIIILGLMSLFLLYKINNLNQTFIERRGTFLPHCSSGNEDSYGFYGHSYSSKLQRVNNVLSSNLHAVHKAHDALRKLKEDLDS